MGNTGMKIDTRSPEEKTNDIFKKIRFEAKHAKYLTTREDCLKAVKMNGYAIGYIPKEYRTDKAIQMAAVTQDGWAIKFLVRDGIPISYKIAFQAVRSSYSAFFFIKDEKMRKAIKPLIPMLNIPAPIDLAL